MGIAKLFGSRRRAADDFVDLGDYMDTNGTASPEAASMYIRVAEIHRLEDIRAFRDFVYKGNMLLLDFNPIVENEALLRRASNELKKVTSDIGGDIAGFGRNMLIIAPTGCKVERTKLRSPGI